PIPHAHAKLGGGAMTLAHYRKLTTEIKALATKYWLAIVLERLQLENLNQLSLFIANREGITLSAQCSASFLYKKWQGSPIDNEIKIKLIDELVPGASRCLTNPIWQLLDNPKPDLVFTNSIL